MAKTPSLPAVVGFARAAVLVLTSFAGAFGAMLMVEQPQIYALLCQAGAT